MAIHQDILSNLPTAPSVSNDTGVQGSDAESFEITVLSPETGARIENVSLRGTHRPFSPVTTPVSQEVQKIYYPGNSNRRPTVQVMGPMDDDVRLEGVFEARRIRDASRREEPMEIVNILDRICREGNICKFQIGPWIKYGFIRQFTPRFKLKSAYEWSMDLMIVGNTNPLQKNQEEETERSDRVFATAEISDLKDIRETVTKSIEDSKTELEETNYLPVIKQELGIPFSIPNWLSQLREKEPIGRVADIGQRIYNEIISSAELANEALTEIDRFVNQVDQVSKETTKFILTFENLRSRMFFQMTSLYNAYSRISSSASTAVRLSAYFPIASIGGLFLNINDFLKKAEDKARASVQNDPVRVHVVKENDTLQKISVKYYGDWERWIEIRDANNLESSDLTVDQVLVIPE